MEDGGAGLWNSSEWTFSPLKHRVLSECRACAGMTGCGSDDVARLSGCRGYEMSSSGLGLRAAFDFEFVDAGLGFGCACWVCSPFVDEAFAGFVADSDGGVGAFADAGF